METYKLRRIIDKYKLTNVLKIAIILIILFLVARAFNPSFSNLMGDVTQKVIQKDNIEGFDVMGYSNYGNELALQDPSNKPTYAGNTCTFKFNNIYRIEGFQLNFNTNDNVDVNGVNPFQKVANNRTISIYVQYEDGNGNLRNIQSSNGINFNNNTNLRATTTLPICSKSDLIDENNLAVYTSKIVISIGDGSNIIDGYKDSCNNGYIGRFTFWGSTRDMLSRTDFENIQHSLNNIPTIKQINSNGDYDASTNTNNFIFTTSEDKLIYGLKISYYFQTITTPTTTLQTGSISQNCTPSTDSPFNLTLMYNNGLYVGNNFSINQTYTIRNDPLIISPPTSTAPKFIYIIFPQPIISNKLTLSSPLVTLLNNYGNKLGLIINSVYFYGSIPNNVDKANYQKNVNLALSSSQSIGKSLDVCPSMDDLMNKQNQTQTICDNLDYQDRIKSEKIRLEKNKQYLLKLQQQQQQIDQLNTVIQTLDSKRQTRANANDQARLLQYKQQRGTASTIRDLANQRLQSQNANQLYMDVNINTT